MSTYAELVYRAKAGDPEAMQILGWDRPSEDPYAMDPYMTQAMMDMYLPAAQFDRGGDPEYQKNLNFQQDVISEQADPVTAGLVGSAGLAPGTFDSTPTWEPVETGTRQELELYANGSGWQGFMARALLDENMTPDEALMAAQKAAEAGEFQLPMQQQQSGPYATAAPDLPDLSLMAEFAQSKFEGLAREPDPRLGEEQGLTRFNEASQQWERRGEDELSPMAEKYRSLGLPIPTDEYSYDWMRQNAPGITDPADQMALSAQANHAEQAAMAKAVLAESQLNRTNREAMDSEAVMRAAGRTPQAPVPFVDQPNAPYEPVSTDFDYREAPRRSSGRAPDDAAIINFTLDAPPPEAPPSYGNEEMQQQDFLNREWNRQERDRQNRPGLLDSLRGGDQYGRRTNHSQAKKQFNNPVQRRRREQNTREQHAAMSEYDKQAIAMYLLQQQGRTPFRDAMQARTQPMMQAGSMPWSG